MEFDINKLISEDKNKIEKAIKNLGGRPKLAQKETKSKKIMVYFTEEEYVIILEKSKLKGSSVSNYVRNVTLGLYS